MEREELEGILEKYGVKAAYIFGSQKEKGVAFLSGQEPVKADMDSDLDVGVVFANLPSCRIEVYSQLYVALNKFFGPFDVDLVFLQETDIFLQYQAIKGEIVYCADRFFVEEYEERIVKQAADLMYKKTGFQKDFFEAVKNGYFRIEC